MKHKIGRLISIVMAGCLLIGQFTAVTAKGNDYSGHWAAEKITKWIDAGLVKSNPDGEFKPDNPITRAEFVALINRVFGFTEKLDSSFKDVKPDQWYADDISKAFEAGLIKGDGNGNIKPEDAISRQEAAVIICNAFDLKAVDPASVKKFTDSGEFPSWSSDAINAIYENGFAKGRSDNTFGYADNITRAESVVMIDNAMGELKNKAGTYSGDIAGNLVVNAKDVILKDMTIGGSLYLTQGIGEGSVTLDNIKVKGKTFVYGGGEHSIVVRNSSLEGQLVVLKKGGKIRIVAEGSSEIPDVRLASGAVLEEDGLTGSGFGDLEILHIPSGQEITLDGDYGDILIQASGVGIQLLDGVVGNLTIAENADNSTISISKDGSLDNLAVNADTSVTGQGSIRKATINSDNVTIEQKPLKTTVSDGYTAMVGGVLIIGGETAPTPVATGGSHRSGRGGNNDNGDSSDNGGDDELDLTTISGTISVDAETDISLASIQLKEGSSYIGSPIHPDGNGAYTFAEVPVGTYTVEITLTGYRPETISGFSVSSTPVTGKDIQLKKYATVSGTVSIGGDAIDTANTSIQLKQDDENIGSAVHPGNDGTYTITDIVAGTYTIDVVSTGYRSGTIPEFTVTPGIAVTEQDITLLPSVATMEGGLYVYLVTTGMLIDTGVPGDIKSLELDYSVHEEFVDGTVVFNIPEEFAADTDDAISLDYGDSYDLLQESQISNFGTTVTIKGLNFDDDVVVVLLLNDKTIPAEGSYIFSATGDADGDLTERSMSPGTEFGSFEFISRPGPIDDLTAYASDGHISLTFSKAVEASSVVLEQSADGVDFSPVDGVELDSSSNSVEFDGLANGTIYYFQLIVTDGVHDGTSNMIATSATRVDPEESSVTIDQPLAPNTTSTITVTIRDSIGSPITTADAYLIYVATRDDYSIGSDNYTGGNGRQDIIMYAPADENGETFFTVTLGDVTHSFFLLWVLDVNGHLIGNFRIY